MKIKIDTSLCREPEICGKCLNNCPTGVFFLHVLGKFSSKPEFQKTIDKLLYKVEPRFKELCNLCMVCVDICPLKAIFVQR